jgi:hypothetical protein
MRWGMGAGAILWSTAVWAFPSGPVVSVGFVVTPQISTAVSGGNGPTAVTVGPLTGPNFQLGYEIGNYVNNQFTLQYTSASGPIAGSGNGVTLDGSASLQMFSVAYQLTWDILGKQGWHGLTPYVGGGLAGGVFNLTEPLQATSGGMTFTSTGQAQGKPYLELHATAGARYTLSNGWGFRADLMYSTFGGFLGTFIPSVWVTYALTP